MGYLTNFIVYTLAMVGVIMLAVLVFKTSTSTGVKGDIKKEVVINENYDAPGTDVNEDEYIIKN